MSQTPVVKACMIIQFTNMANKPYIFEVDVAHSLKGYTLSPQEVQEMISQVLDNVSDLFLDKWRAKASQGLKGTRSAYIRALYKSDRGANIRVVGLRPEAKLANMIELGAGAFDMKDNFRSSPKRKMKLSGKGWYLTIPLRFATPDALGENEAFAGKLPDEVYDLVKGKKPTKTREGQIIQHGDSLKLEDIPEAYRDLSKREEIPSLGKEKGAEYISKSSMYEGLQRIEKIGSPQQSTYMTFRRVSDTSPANSWIHKGLNPRNFAGKTFSEMNSGDFRNIVDNTIDKFLSNR